MITIVIISLALSVIACGRWAWNAHVRIDRLVDTVRSNSFVIGSLQTNLDSLQSDVRFLQNVYSAQHEVNEKLYSDIQALKKVDGFSIDSFAYDLLQKLPADCFSSDSIIQPCEVRLTRLQHNVLCVLCDYLHFLDNSLKSTEKVSDESKVD